MECIIYFVIFYCKIVCPPSTDGSLCAFFIDSNTVQRNQSIPSLGTHKLHNGTKCFYQKAWNIEKKGFYFMRK